MAVPWGQIIKWAPQIIGLSRELLNRSRSTKPSDTLVRASDSGDLAGRVLALEENERRQAELVDQMAAQTAELSQAVITLHRRQRALIITVVVLACALLYVRWAS